MGDYYLTNPSSIKQRNILNIPAWHAAGYTGKDQVFFHDDLGETGHNDLCKSIIQTNLPDSNGLSGKINNTSKDGLVTSCTMSCNETKEVSIQFDEFIRKYNITLINNSTDGGKNNSESALAKYMRNKIKEHNFIGTGAFGNYSAEPTNRYQGAFVMFSGITLMADGTYRDYGVAGDACDFATFMGPSGGTSFAGPTGLSMFGLLRSKYGRSLTQEQAYQYFKNHCVDLGIPGRDPNWGWGLPILGAPTEKYIRIPIGKNYIWVDGKNILTDVSAIVDPTTSKTLVPLRIISETLGAIVKWEPDINTATLIKGNITITLQPLSNIMKINGVEKVLECAPKYNSAGTRLLVPVRAISEGFNCKVDWVQSTQEVLIFG